MVKTNLTFFIVYFLFISFVSIAEELPDGYKSYSFGMSIGDVKNAISQDSLLQNVREDVLSIRIEPDKQILTVLGDRRNGGYVEKIYFHFHEDKLFHIYLQLSSTKVGYYSLLKRLTEKYGNAGDLKPKRAVWENDTVRIQIEKPCVLKYTDLEVWNSLSSTEEEMEARKREKIGREEFLDDL